MRQQQFQQEGSNSSSAIFSALNRSNERLSGPNQLPQISNNGGSNHGNDDAGATEEEKSSNESREGTLHPIACQQCRGLHKVGFFNNY